MKRRIQPYHLFIARELHARFNNGDGSGNDTALNRGNAAGPRWRNETAAKVKIVEGVRAMGQNQIVIGDRSACYAHLHSDGLERLGAVRVRENPVPSSPHDAKQLASFNADHPLFGGRPVDILVPSRTLRRQNCRIECHVCSSPIPDHSCIQLREGLFLIGAELAFARMANTLSVVLLAELGTNLCARYWLDGDRIADRTTSAATPETLKSFLDSATKLRGRSKVLRALKWVLPNSGSPLESKMQLQFRIPLGSGGFALPFDAMNYDVLSGRLAGHMGQNKYCIDMVSTGHRIGLEYDGQEYHSDVAADKRRLNALRSLDWTVFPIDKSMLYDAGETERAAFQIARTMGLRIQKPKSWEGKFALLRQDLGLPC